MNVVRRAIGRHESRQVGVMLFKIKVHFCSGGVPVLMVHLMVRDGPSIPLENYPGKLGRLGTWLLGSKATCPDLVPVALFFVCLLVVGEVWSFHSGRAVLARVEGLGGWRQRLGCQ